MHIINHTNQEEAHAHTHDIIDKCARVIFVCHDELMKLLAVAATTLEKKTENNWKKGAKRTFNQIDMSFKNKTNIRTLTLYDIRNYNTLMMMI